MPRHDDDEIAEEMARLALERARVRLASPMPTQPPAKPPLDGDGTRLMNNVEEMIGRLGIMIPEPPTPSALYLPWTRAGDILIVSGQGTRVDGIFKHIGRLGDSISLDEGREAARICALNLLANVRSACDGDLSRVAGVLRITGYVNSTPDFREHPAVINACSELMIDVFGDAGWHARTAIGAASLPNGMAVEIEGMFRIRDA